MWSTHFFKLLQAVQGPTKDFTIKTIKRDKSIVVYNTSGLRSRLKIQSPQEKTITLPQASIAHQSVHLSTSIIAHFFVIWTFLFVSNSLSLSQVSREEKEKKRKNSQKSVSYGPTRSRYNKMLDSINYTRHIEHSSDMYTGTKKLFNSFFVNKQIYFEQICITKAAFH